jgi:hypothetical protein
MVLASRLRGWDPSASPSLRCSSEFWLWPGWRCWSEPPSSALPQGPWSLSGGSSPASRAVRFDDGRRARDPGAEFIAHGLSRRRIIGIGELPLDAFLRTPPDPNKAGLSARDRQFESGSLQRRVGRTPSCVLLARVNPHQRCAVSEARGNWLRPSSMTHEPQPISRRNCSPAPGARQHHRQHPLPALAPHHGGQKTATIGQLLGLVARDRSPEHRD